MMNTGGATQTKVYMSNQLESDIKKPLYYIIILVISLAATWLFFASGLICYWDRVIYDLCIKNRVLKTPEVKRNPLIVSIDLDDISIKKLSNEIDNRQAFADLLDVLADVNAAPIMDFIYAVEKNNDRDFIRALSQSENAVIAAAAIDKGMLNELYKALDDAERNALDRHVWRKIKVTDEGNIPEAESFLLPFPALLNVVKPYSIGLINMEPDSDGIYRRVPLLYEWDGGYIPSLPLAAAVKYLSIPVESETIELKAGEYLILSQPEKEAIRIPIDEKGRMLIPYTETWAKEIKEKNRNSFHEIADANYYDDNDFSKISGRFSGKSIALVAEISTSQKDFGPTSFEKTYPLSIAHAEVLSGILNSINKKALISWAPIWYKVIILILLLTIAFPMSTS
jgi:CHASE2 domain-containing sensor protein